MADNAPSDVFDLIEKTAREDNPRPQRRPHRPLHSHKMGQRARYPGKAVVIAAVHERGLHSEEGWAHPESIADRLWASRPAVIRWCRALAAEGLLEEQAFGYQSRRRRAESPFFRVKVRPYGG